MKAVRELTQHVRQRLQKLANRTLAKRLVGETVEYDDDNGEDDGYGDNDEGDDDDDDNK